MRCPNCQKEMRPLFFSVACDYCDGGPPPWVYRGFVIKTEKNVFPFKGNVFPTYSDAYAWLQTVGVEVAEVLGVKMANPVCYRRLSRYDNISFAVTEENENPLLFEIHKDHKFEPLPGRCFVIQEK